jgi:hypothetical protein
MMTARASLLPRERLREAIASSISSSIREAVMSQEVRLRTSRIFFCRVARSRGVAASARSQATVNSSGVDPRYTMSPYGSATSVIGVLTIIFAAAMYSSVFVGLMYLVESLRAKGSRHTSQPFK